MSKLKTYYESAKVELSKVIETLNGLDRIETPVSESNTDLDMTKIQPLIDLLKEQLDNYETDAKNTIKELIDLTSGTKLSEIINKVALRIDNYENEEALEELKGI